MYRRTSKSIVLLIIVFLAFDAVTSNAADGDNVLARVQGQSVTRAQIEELLTGELLKLDRQRHDLVSNAVVERVRDILSEQEAAHRGITKDELLELEVGGKTAAVPAEDVDRFYSSRRLRQPKASVEPQIRRYLAYEQFITGLESRADVEILTEPFRIAVEGEGPAKGSEKAPVEIVEFGDFECPPCGQTYSVLKKIRQDYGDKVRVVFRQFPLLSIHPNAQKAGEASLCANDQGKFWEMHDKMFENQKKLSVDGLKSMALEIADLDAGAFNSCLDSGRHAEAVQSDMRDGQRAGVGGTPAFFVNGRFVSGALSYEAFAKLIEEEVGP